MPEVAEDHQHIPGLVCSTCGQFEPIRNYREAPARLKNVASENCEQTPVTPSQKEVIVKLADGSEIKWQRQKGKTDCGPAVLSMLGYNDIEWKAVLLNQERQLNTHDVYLRVPGAEWIEDPQESPQSGIAMRLLALNTGSNHWVLDVQSQNGERVVLCPAYGVVPADTYSQRVTNVLYEFAVPLRSQVAANRPIV